MAGAQTHYEVLGIETEANYKDVKKAYRKLVVAHHPDKDHSEGAVERFQRIQLAYDVLSDSMRRKQYDEALANGGTDVVGTSSQAVVDRVSPLMHAAEDGDVGKVSELLSQGAQVDDVDAFDRTALMYAASAGQAEAVEALLAAGANITYKDSEGMTPFLFAAGGRTRILELSPGTMKCLRVLLDASSDVNIWSTRGLTALSLACKAGSPAVLNFLLARKANPDQDLPGASLTPLAYAAHRGHVKVVDMLLNSKAGVNKGDADGETALMSASGAGHQAVVDLLIRNGADAKICTQDGSTALLSVVEEFVDRRITQEATAAIVKQLIDIEADPIASTIDGRTPLKIAARRKDGAWLEDLLTTAACSLRQKNTSCSDCLAGFKIMFS